MIPASAKYTTRRQRQRQMQQRGTSTSTFAKREQSERLFPLAIPRTHHIVPTLPLPASVRWSLELWLARKTTATHARDGEVRVGPLFASARFYYGHMLLNCEPSADD